YFAARAWQSRVGAWASEQSEPIGSRAQLLEAVKENALRFCAPTPRAPGADDSLRLTIPRPPPSGRGPLRAEAVEVWVEGAARIHDRARWQRTIRALPKGSFRADPWVATRLQP